MGTRDHGALLVVRRVTVPPCPAVASARKATAAGDFLRSPSGRPRQGAERISEPQAIHGRFPPTTTTPGGDIRPEARSETGSHAARHAAPAGPAAGKAVRLRRPAWARS